MCITAVTGQTISLVYFQAENNLPYTLTWNGQTYISDSQGVLLMRNMPAGEQTFLIALGKDHGTASRFQLRLGEDSRAFSIRQLLDNRLQLFDLVSYGLTRGTRLPAIKEPVIYQNPLAGFPQTVWRVYEVQEKGVSTLKETGTLSPVIEANTEQALPWHLIPLEVKKVFDQTGSEGIDQIYLVTSEGKTDTIALFIPVLSLAAPKSVGKTGSADRETIQSGQKPPLPWESKNKQLFIPPQLF